MRGDLDAEKRRLSNMQNTDSSNVEIKTTQQRAKKKY